MNAADGTRNFVKEMGAIWQNVELPGPNTPLPPTNATIHVLKSEDGYGTPARQFNALCGVSWKAAESTGEHKYFHREETHWHKHVNCQVCIDRLKARGE